MRLFGATYDWRASTLSQLVDEFQDQLPDDAFGAYVLGNHDISRLASRTNQPIARAAALLLLALPGTKFIYYGEELGMEDVEIPTNRVVDPSNVPRDPERTPMRWNASQYSGFSTVDPWLPLGVDTGTRNVEVMTSENLSILNLYRQLTELLRQHTALQDGAFERLALNDASVYGFKRVAIDEQLLVLINTADKPHELAVMPANGELLISTTLTHHDKRGNLEHIRLDAYEAVIIRLES